MIGQQHARTVRYTRKALVPILEKAGWAPGPVWTCGISRPHRDSIPERATLSHSLYWLSYPAHCLSIKPRYSKWDVTFISKYEKLMFIFQFHSTLHSHFISDFFCSIKICSFGTNLFKLIQIFFKYIEMVMDLCNCNSVEWFSSAVGIFYWKWNLMEFGMETLLHG